MTLSSFYILCCSDKSQFFSVQNVTIRVRRKGVNFDSPMSLLKMSLLGREGGGKDNNIRAMSRMFFLVLY